MQKSIFNRYIYSLKIKESMIYADVSIPIADYSWQVLFINQNYDCEHV